MRRGLHRSTIPQQKLNNKAQHSKILIGEVSSTPTGHRYRNQARKRQKCSKKWGRVVRTFGPVSEKQVRTDSEEEGEKKKRKTCQRRSFKVDKKEVETDGEGLFYCCCRVLIKKILIISPKQMSQWTLVMKKILMKRVLMEKSHIGKSSNGKNLEENFLNGLT